MGTPQRMMPAKPACKSRESGRQTERILCIKEGRKCFCMRRRLCCAKIKEIQNLEEQDMKIAMANDHAAVAMKKEIQKMLEDEGYEIINLGTDTDESVDYPFYGENCAKAVVNGDADYGIVICGTGIGISIAANKVPGTRCGLCRDVTDARLTREHNDANMLAMGARTTGMETAKDIVHAFLATPFSNGANHIRRIHELAELDGSAK